MSLTTSSSSSNPFKISTIIESTEFYILKLIYPSVTLIEGHRGARKQKLLRQLSLKVLIGFGCS